MPAARPDWGGRTVVCIASGPSLTQEDCDATRGHPTVVTNTTFRMAPWADIVFGFDSLWWNAIDPDTHERYVDEVKRTCRGRMLCPSQVVKNLGIESTFGCGWFTQYANSGACSISMAIGAGATKVVLLGFDSKDGPRGEKHWHKNHPVGKNGASSNCKSMPNWPAIFNRVADHARKHGVPVINCTRSSALKCFPKVDLQEAIRDN